MFGKQLNRSNVCNLAQVTMIESKCERPESSFRKKVNMPATVFTKSPMRDRENKSIVGNTPSRKNQLSRVTMGGAADDQNRRSSISPLKNRRQQLGMQPTGNSFIEQNSSYHQTQPLPTSYHSVRQQPQLSNSIHSQVSKSRKIDSCQNHSNKPAKYYIFIDDEDLPYCEKCAILLASQGFKVVKADEAGEPQQNVQNNSQMFQPSQQQSQQPSLLDDHNHPRRQEIGSFLSELDFIMQALEARKSDVDQAAEKAESQFQHQNLKVAEFYQHIVNEVLNHQKTVEAALAEQHSQLMASYTERMDTVNEAVTDSRTMKQDILSSLDLIKDAEEKDYRPILESYKQNARKFKQISQKVPVKSEFKLIFGNCSEALKRFFKSLTAALAGEKDPVHTQPNRDTSSHSSINFSFEGRTREEEVQRQHDRSPKLSPVGMIEGKCHPGPQSEDQNPIELLSEQDLSREKFMKSSLKDHNGLFSEFDDFAV